MFEVKRVLSLLNQHENRYHDSFYMVPSENSMSSLSRLPLVLDVYNRYFFSNDSLWGKWAFHGGKELGKIEMEILIPLLKDYCKAGYVNVKPISGLNCMTVVLAALCQAGDDIFLVHPDMGGHISTKVVCEKLCLNVHFIPCNSYFEVDFNIFGKMLSNIKPKLVYIDQATMLFPIKVKFIKEVVCLYSPDTNIHVDTSHINAFVFSGALPNPLESGANSFGGSTHKTFPGPHKGFFATNDTEIANDFETISNDLVSHHHMAEVVSFTLSLLEFKYKDGKEYVDRMVKNAKFFASTLDRLGFDVIGKENDFTECHQIWVDPSKYMDPYDASEKLYEAGILINAFGKLPGTNGPSFRIAFNEVTRLGLSEHEFKLLACFFEEIIKKNGNISDVSIKVKELRKKFQHQRYCLLKEEINAFLNDIEADALLQWKA